MFFYWGFGLHIASEIQFPEFLEIQSLHESEVTIKLGVTPTELLGENITKRVNVSMSPTEYLQIMPVATYYVSNGNQIIIQPNEGADLKSIRLFLLSNAIAALLHQRNSIPMHASAVYYEDGIVLFCGKSGAGKSTIATSLSLKGYRIFSDDVCVLINPEQDGKEIFAFPSYPMIKLWVDAYSKMELGEFKEADKIRPNLAKYSRFFHDEFSSEPMKILKVFIIDSDNNANHVEVAKLLPMQGFKRLQQNSYRHVQMNGMNKRNFHFSVISKLASLVTVYSLSRPIRDNTIEEVIGIIESKLVEHE